MQHRKLAAAQFLPEEQEQSGVSGLVGFFAEHSYLSINLVGLAVVLMAMRSAGRHRNAMLVAGIIQSLHAPFAFLFDDVYWSPRRLGGIAIGVEDMLFTLSLGAGVWLAAVILWRDRIVYRATLREGLLRAGVIAIVPILPAVALRRSGLSIMETDIIVMVGMAAGLAWRRPDLSRLAVAALLIYTPYYVLFLYFCGWMFPDFFAIWNGPELWERRLLGLPLDEVGFILAYTLCFPLIVGTTLDARLADRATLFASAVTVQRHDR